MLDARAGESASGICGYDFAESGNDNPCHISRNIKSGVHFGDSGGPSRFFYCAKASRGEREAGLDKQSLRAPQVDSGSICGGCPAAAKIRNNHPTVKSIDLNRWLAALLLPPASVPQRRILVPFAGSGSEMIGALLAGWDEITGIEREADYCRIADARLAHWAKKIPTRVSGESEISGAKEMHAIVPAQPSLFG